MKAFILAAGLGQRVRPLTERQPKPLIEVGGKPLILWHIEKLREAGITELVINCHWLAEQLIEFLGGGERFGVRIHWSPEPDLLDTGGGMRAALEKLGAEPFALISADIWSDFDYRLLAATKLGQGSVANLVVVPNPTFYPRGDFGLEDQGRLVLPGTGGMGVTYAGMGLLDPAWIEGWSIPEPVFAWTGPLLEAVRAGEVEARLHRGLWTDVGSPERLFELRAELDDPGSA